MPISALERAYQGKRVLVTGHTGFKGSWLCQWLLSMGAEVHGFALDPQPHELLYGQLGLAQQLASDTRGDIRDAACVKQAIERIQPDHVFHLAAQPLVRLSYDIPVETYAVNVMGTIHVLEALRSLHQTCAAVMVTTDKCYENREWLHGYREEDAMGGYDPYSSSKGAAELAISAWRRSFFHDHPVKISSARAGNVIGGGDWALDRIVPDCIRAMRAGEAIPVRNKTATRPWQHVLEPLSGYLWLGACLYDSALTSHPSPLISSAFNFGPALASNRTVAELVMELLKHVPGEWSDASGQGALHEASKLNLTIDKAFHMLQWQPVWPFEESIERTAQWYMQDSVAVNRSDLTISQISDYHAAAAAHGLPWAL